MKQTGKSFFISISIICLTIFCVGFLGVSSTYGDITTDIINGIHLVPRGNGFTEDVTLIIALDSESDSELDFDVLKNVYERRLTLSSAVEFEVYPDTEGKSFFITIPYDKTVKENMSFYGTILTIDGLFELREGSETDDDGNPVGITENVILSNEHIKLVRPMVYSESTQGNIFYLEIELNSEGRKIMNRRAQEVINAADEEETVYFSAWIDGDLVDYYAASQLLDAKKITAFSSSSSGYSLEEVTTLSIAVSGGKLGAPLRVNKIIINNNSGFAGEKSFSLVLYSFGTALLLIGAALIIRYKLAGLCGFISILGCLGLLFLVLTRFYGDPTVMQLTNAVFSSILIILISGIANVIYQCETIRNSELRNSALGKTLGEGLRTNQNAIFASYCGLFIIGLLMSDIFKRTGGLATTVITWIVPLYSADKYFVLGHFGTLICIGALFSILTVLLANRLMISSLLSYSYFAKPKYFTGAKDEKL